MKLLSLLVIALAVLAQSRDYENVEGYTYAEYVAEFGKLYSSVEGHESHKAIFEQNLAKIIAHNKDSTQSWKAGVNQFTDMTAEEFKAHKGYNKNLARLHRSTTPLATVPAVAVEDLPTSVDWRTHNVVTPVKNQGGCGSCWAFATTESIESTVAQDTGHLLELSPQNVVSCTLNPHHCGGTGGCNGAIAELGFDYVNHHGIAAEKDYPYRAVTGTCDETKKKSASVKGFVKLPENNYTALVTAVATVGPIAISVDASAWSMYSSGVFNGCNFNRVDIDHAVQLVGYGTTGSTDYWIVRNSWGRSWGEQGYIRLFKHSDGDMKWCGVDPSPGDGSGCDGGPSKVTVCGTCGIWYDTSYPTGGSVV